MLTTLPKSASNFLVQGLLRNRTLTVREFDNGFSVSDRGKEEFVEYSRVEAFQFAYAWNALRGSDYSITIWTDLSAAFKTPRPGKPGHGFQLWRPRDPANRRKSFRFAKGPEIVEPPDETLLSIRKMLSDTVTDRLKSELRTGCEVPWVPRLSITHNGLEFRDGRNNLSIPFADISDVSLDPDGMLRISTPIEQVLQLGSSDINFYPGLAIVRDMLC